MTKRIINQEYNKFLAGLKKRVASSQYKADLSINREQILLYHHIGMQILEAQSKQGWKTKIAKQSLIALQISRNEGIFYTKSKIYAQIRQRISWRKICARGTCTMTWYYNVIM